MNQPIKSLQSELGSKKIRFWDDLDNAEASARATDRTNTPGRFDALALPESTEEIQTILRFANEHSIPITPSGGRTGYSGGAVCSSGINLSLEKMDQIFEFDPYLQSLRVQAGAITANVQQAAMQLGKYFPMEFASSGSSQIGGNAATNAGGIHVIRYGMMRQQILGMVCVDGKGEILRFKGDLLKDNSGYDLKSLIVGSEGTLAVITELTLKLYSPVEETVVFLIAIDTFEESVEYLSRLQTPESHTPADLLAFEYFDRKSLEIVCKHLDISEPLQASTPPIGYVIGEIVCKKTVTGETNIDPTLELLSTLSPSVRVGITSKEKKELWRYRESISESISMDFYAIKNDISIPTGKMSAFLKQLDLILAKEEYTIFGHLGDGNLHINIIEKKTIPMQAFQQRLHEKLVKVYQLIQEFGGAISAEHGIGLLKKEYLNTTKTDREIEIMKQIKLAFDPNRILNPGKIFDF